MAQDRVDAHVAASAAGQEPKIVTRAVMVFIPDDKFTHFVKEFRWFFLSWSFTVQWQPKNFRTDLLVFSSARRIAQSEVLRDLGCSGESSTWRQNADEKSRCEARPHFELHNRDTTMQVDLREYHYMDSMLILADYEGFEYDFAIRSDLDAFLPPGFGAYVPEPANSVVVGMGGYDWGNKYMTNKHLAYTMSQLGIQSSFISASFPRSSHWYSTPL